MDRERPAHRERGVARMVTVAARSWGDGDPLVFDVVRHGEEWSRNEEGALLLSARKCAWTAKSRERAI